MFDSFIEKLENILKFGKVTNIKGKDGDFQKIQIKTLRNIEDALKIGNFGFNSKLPIDSKIIVAKIGNEGIVIANEHRASIIDISTGNVVLYNQSGHTIKIEGDTITTTAPKLINECVDFTINSKTINMNSETTNINATSKVNFTAPLTEHLGNLNLTGDNTTIGIIASTSLITTGSITGVGGVTSGTTPFSTHQHVGVSSGNDVSGPPA
tara:strand:- start:1245 stop:1874 length:630 start_codon:yes stop_codon:yes gene_type:complete